MNQHIHHVPRAVLQLLMYRITPKLVTLYISMMWCALQTGGAMDLNVTFHSPYYGNYTGDEGTVTILFQASPNTRVGEWYIIRKEGGYWTVTVNGNGTVTGGWLYNKRGQDMQPGSEQTVGGVLWSEYSGDTPAFDRPRKAAASEPVTFRRIDVPTGQPFPGPLPAVRYPTATVVIQFGDGPILAPPKIPDHIGRDDRQTGGDGERKTWEEGEDLKDWESESKKNRADCGMIRYSLHLLEASLYLSDTPLAYRPAFGPSLDFTVTYSQKGSQRAIVPGASLEGFSNLGPRWSFNWLSYVTDTPGSDIKAEVYQRGGGVEMFSGFQAGSQSYAPDAESYALLVKVSQNSYEKRFPSGVRYVFGKSNGATSWPRRIYLTQVIDPSGNAVTLGYDTNCRLETITDASGKILQLAYEAFAQYYRITKVTDPFGRTALFSYSLSGQLTQITDAIGLTSSVSYAADSDFVSSVTTPYATTQFAVGGDATACWVEATDFNNAKERVEYRGYTSELTDSESPSPTDADNAGLRFRNSFYWDKKAMAVAPGDYAKARITHWLLSPDGINTVGIPSSTKAPLECRVWFQYFDQPASNRVGTMQEPASVARILDDNSTQSSLFEYNALGKTTKVTDSRGRRTELSYDATGFDLQEIRQTTGTLNDLLAKFENYSNHQPTKITDAAGRVTNLVYNARGQLTSATNPKSETVTYAYVDLATDAKYGLVQSEARAGGGLLAVASFTYDAYNRLLTTKQEEGAGTADDYTLTLAYDAVGGNPLKSFDRLTRVTYPDGTFKRMDYDRLDLVDTYDRLGRKTHRVFDGLQHLTSVTDPAGRTTQYVHCPCGAMDKIIDARGNETEWVRDLQKRVTAKKIAGEVVATYEYEMRTSRVKKVSDAVAGTPPQSTNFAYYADNHVQAISYLNALRTTSSVSYTYALDYDRVLTMTDGFGTTTYGYVPVNGADAVYGDGQVASVDGPWANDTLAYTYDELGRVMQRTLNGEAAVNNGFDGLGRTTSQVNALGTFTTWYVGNTGRVDFMTYGNGQRVQLSYLGATGDDRLAQIRHSQTATGPVLSQHDYLYDAVGRITEWKQDWAGRAFAQKVVPGYDGADQLTGAVLRNASTNELVKSYGYDYDTAGNRIGETLDGVLNPALANGKNQLTEVGGAGLMEVGGTLSEPSTVKVNGAAATMNADGLRFTLRPAVTSGVNALTIEATETTGIPAGLNAQKTTKNYSVNVAAGARKTLAYDANGSMSSDGGVRTFEWDAANRLTRILYTGTNLTTELSYDGLSRCAKLVEKNNGTVTSEKHFVWEGMAIAEERDASNAVTKRFFGPGVQLGTMNYYYTRDHLGSIREVTDSTGAVRTRYDYDLYGRRTKINGGASDPEAEFGFTGHYFHATSGLHLAPFRQYDASFGRWLSRDPIEEKGGPNLFGYVTNNPVNSFDPLGLLPPEQYNAIQEVLLREHLYGTEIAAEMSSNTGGDGTLEPLNSTFAPNIPTKFGNFDVDWFTDIKKHSAGPDLDWAIAPTLYTGAKLLWSGWRALQGITIGNWRPFQDEGERHAIDAIVRGLKYSDIFDDEFMAKERPPCP